MIRSLRSALVALSLLTTWGLAAAQDQSAPADPAPTEAAAAPAPANDNNGMSAGMDTTTVNTIDKRPDCFSCLIKVTDELAEFGARLSLQGNWLFAKGGEGTDDYDFMNPTLDTKNWVLLKTPGKWSDAYPGDKPFKSWLMRSPHGGRDITDTVCGAARSVFASRRSSCTIMARIGMNWLLTTTRLPQL